MDKLPYMKLSITKAKWRRIMGFALILAHLSSLGCSTVRTIPAPKVDERPNEEQQKAILDFNASAEGEEAAVVRRPTRTDSLTAIQSTDLVGKRVTYRVDGEDKNIWVTQVDYPLVIGSTHRNRRTNQRSYELSQFNIRDLQWIEINHPRLRVTSVKIVVDSIYWYSPDDELQQIPVAKVETVVLNNRGRGALEGFGIGILVGGVLGAIMGYAEGDDTSGFWRESASEKATYGGIGFGLLGGIVGIIIGAGRGHHYVYHFDCPDVQALGCLDSPFGSTRRAHSFRNDRRPESSARTLHCAIKFGF
jgi:hypothetical protein